MEEWRGCHRRKRLGCWRYTNRKVQGEKSLEMSWGLDISHVGRKKKEKRFSRTTNQAKKAAWSQGKMRTVLSSIGK